MHRLSTSAARCVAVLVGLELAAGSVCSTLTRPHAPGVKLPRRPTRPALCTYSTALSGAPREKTCVTPGRSRPLAALGVASSSVAVLSLKACIACSSCD